MFRLTNLFLNQDNRFQAYRAILVIYEILYFNV